MFNSGWINNMIYTLFVFGTLIQYGFGGYIVSDEAEPEIVTRGQSSTTSPPDSSKSSGTTEPVDTSDPNIEIRKVALNYYRLQNRITEVTKIMCTVSELHEQNLKLAFNCYNKPYENAPWYQKCSKEVFGQNWTYRRRRYLICVKPEETQQQWRTCIHKEFNKDKYTVDNGQGTTEASSSKSEDGVVVVRKEWSELTEAEKREVVKILKMRYEYHLSRIACMERALGISRQ